MKKCYLVPNFQVSNVEVENVICTSPFNNDNASTGEIALPPTSGGGSAGSSGIGVGQDGDARQRGGDFGSLW